MTNKILAVIEKKMDVENIINFQVLKSFPAPKSSPT
jgi:hypothetical protein